VFVAIFFIPEHRGHKEKWQSSVISVYSVVDYLCKYSFFQTKGIKIWIRNPQIRAMGTDWMRRNSVTSDFGNNADSSGFLDPLFWGKCETVQTCLHSNPSVTVSQPIPHKVIRALDVLIASDFRDANVVIILLGNYCNSGTLTFEAFVGERLVVCSEVITKTLSLSASRPPFP